MSERYVATGKAGSYTSGYAKKRISAEIRQMIYEVSRSEKSSSRLEMNKNQVTGRTYVKSTFPSFMRESGISTKKDFLKIASENKGVRFNRVKAAAISRIHEGYKNEHGYNAPDREFGLKTGYLYDNKNVIFRYIRGRVIPLRLKNEAFKRIEKREPKQKKGDFFNFDLF